MSPSGELDNRFFINIHRFLTLIYSDLFRFIDHEHFIVHSRLYLALQK